MSRLSWRSAASSSHASISPSPESSRKATSVASSSGAIAMSSCASAPPSSVASSLPSPDASKPDLEKRSPTRAFFCCMCFSSRMSTRCAPDALAASSRFASLASRTSRSRSSFCCARSSSCAFFALARSNADGPHILSRPSRSSSGLMTPEWSASTCAKRSRMRMLRRFISSSSRAMTAPAWRSTASARGVCAARVIESSSSSTERSPSPSGSMYLGDDGERRGQRLTA